MFSLNNEQLKYCAYGLMTIFIIILLLNIFLTRINNYSFGRTIEGFSSDSIEQEVEQKYNEAKNKVEQKYNEAKNKVTDSSDVNERHSVNKFKAKTQQKIKALEDEFHFGSGSNKSSSDKIDNLSAIMKTLAESNIKARGYTKNDLKTFYDNLIKTHRARMTSDIAYMALMYSKFEKDPAKLFDNEELHHKCSKYITINKAFESLSKEYNLLF